MLRKKSLTSLVILFWVTAAPLFGCTIVMAAKDGKVLVGNNEDRSFYKTTIRFFPATEKHFGRIIFGYTDSPFQGGMNDQGLSIDGNALSPTGWEPEEGKPDFRGMVIFSILATCASRNGDSMVVEYGQGKVQFVEREEYYLIATNFVFTNVTNGNYPCSRYRTADRILREAESLDISLIRNVLDATHQEGRSPTVYSNIYDLKNGQIHIYNTHDFSRAVTLDFNEELAKGTRTINLPSLFGESGMARQKAGLENQI